MRQTLQSEVPVFKSGDDDKFAQATAIVKTLGLPFRVFDAYEGADPSWRVHWLFVKASDTEMVRDALRDIPGEIILASSVSGEDKRNNRSIAAIQLALLAFIVILGIVFALMRK